MTTSPSNPLVWMFDHLSYLGWSTVLYACYRMIRMTFYAGSMFTIVKERVLEGEKTLVAMATNHLPHMQIELEKHNMNAEKTNGLLVELKDAIKDLK